MNPDHIVNAIGAAAAACVAALLITTALPAPVAGQAIPVPLSTCVAEDGSTDGQAFPCMWDATVQGNRQGSSFVLFRAA